MPRYHNYVSSTNSWNKTQAKLGMYAQTNSSKYIPGSYGNDQRIFIHSKFRAVGIVLETVPSVPYV